MHDTFKGSLLGCFENVSYTSLTIVCTINVSIDCDGFDVSNPNERKIYTNENQDDEMLRLCLFLKIVVCKNDDFSAFRATKFINENFGKCTRMYTRSTQNGIDCGNNPKSSLLVAT